MKNDQNYDRYRMMAVCLKKLQLGGGGLHVRQTHMGMYSIMNEFRNFNPSHHIKRYLRCVIIC